MKAQHTPGPWEITEHTWSHTSVHANKHTVATLNIYDDVTEDNQEAWEVRMKADATLIASAPKLLSSLQNLCIVFADMCERTGYSAGEYYSYRAARAAIAKALGASNE